MFEVLIDNRYTLTSALLFAIGMAGVMLHPNLIKKVISFNIMDSSIFLFLTTRGFIEGRSAAVLHGTVDVSAHVNPIPAGLVLTGIVVSVSISAFSLALIQRLYRRYGSVDMRRILELSRDEEE